MMPERTAESSAEPRLPRDAGLNGSRCANQQSKAKPAAKQVNKQRDFSAIKMRAFNENVSSPVTGLLSAIASRVSLKWLIQRCSLLLYDLPLESLSSMQTFLACVDSVRASNGALRCALKASRWKQSIDADRH